MRGKFVFVAFVMCMFTPLCQAAESAEEKHLNVPPELIEDIKAQLMLTVAHASTWSFFSPKLGIPALTLGESYTCERKNTDVLTIDVKSDPAYRIPSNSVVKLILSVSLTKSIDDLYVNLYVTVPFGGIIVPLRLHLGAMAPELFPVGPVKVNNFPVSTHFPSIPMGKYEVVIYFSSTEVLSDDSYLGCTTFNFEAVSSGSTLSLPGIIDSILNYSPLPSFPFLSKEINVNAEKKPIDELLLEA